MIIAPHCCCGDTLANDQKDFSINCIWSGFSPWSAQSGYNYLNRQDVYSNSTGTRTQSWEADEDSGVVSMTDEETEGFEWPFGDESLVSSSTTPTEDIKVYFSSSVGITTTITRTLSSAFTFQDFVIKWKTRMETLCPLATMDQPVPILAQWPEPPVLVEATRNLVFATDYPVDYAGPEDTTRIYTRVILRPSITKPWDGKYTADFLAVPVALTGQNPFGVLARLPRFTPTFGIVPGEPYQPPAYNTIFTRTCNKFKDGFGCDAPDVFRADGVRVRFDDARLRLSNPDSGSMTSPVLTGLTLSPGIYSFDGQTLVIHSGSKLNPTTPNAWFDHTGDDSHYGVIELSLATPASLCPP